MGGNNDDQEEHIDDSKSDEGLKYNLLRLIFKQTVRRNELIKNPYSKTKHAFFNRVNSNIEKTNQATLKKKH